MAQHAYDDICFVIMPFGVREVGERQYDFDAIFGNVFSMAISMVSLPNGKRLRAKRADSPNTPGMITQEMFRDILYSRIVLADITGLNPNVFYELGVRHALRPTSTVVFKEVHSTIPFDVRDLRIFDYDVEEGLRSYGAAVQRIRTSLEESLSAGVLDSPVVQALRDDIQWPADLEAQRRYKLRSFLEGEKERAALDFYIQEARAAIGKRDLARAEASLRGGLALVPDDLRVSLDLAALLRDKGDLAAAEPILTRVTENHPKFAPAWRELGVVQNKLQKFAESVQTLQHATELNAYDAEAWGSLGGALKSMEQYVRAQEAYLKAFHLDADNPYVLLNYFTIHAQNNHSLPDPGLHRGEMQRAEKTCRTEIAANTRLPWCHFDLAQILFFRDDMAGFEEHFRKGANAANARWQVETAANTYSLLQASGIPKPDTKKARDVTELVLSEFGKNP